MPEVEYDDRSEEPQWRLPSRTEPGIVGRALDENQHATRPGGPSRALDDSEYQSPADLSPTTPTDLPSLPMAGFGAGFGVLITGIAIMLISGDPSYSRALPMGSWIVAVGLAILGASLLSWWAWASHRD